MVSEEKISGFYVCPKLPSPTRVVGIAAKKTGDGAAVSLSLPLLSGPPLSTEPDYEPNVGAPTSRKFLSEPGSMGWRCRHQERQLEV